VDGVGGAGDERQGVAGGESRGGGGAGCLAEAEDDRHAFRALSGHVGTRWPASFAESRGSRNGEGLATDENHQRDTEPCGRSEAKAAERNDEDRSSEMNPDLRTVPRTDAQVPFLHVHDPQQRSVRERSRPLQRVARDVYVPRGVSTTRNRASPLIIRSYASAARSSGKTSVMGRTPASALKASVSSESMDVPDGHPTIDRRPPMSGSAGTPSAPRGA